MTEDGIPGALHVDVQKESDTQRQEEEERGMSAPGFYFHRLEYVEFPPALSSEAVRFSS